MRSCKKDFCWGPMEWWTSKAQRARSEGRRPLLMSALADERRRRSRLCQLGERGKGMATSTHYRAWGLAIRRLEAVFQPYIIIYIYIYIYIYIDIHIYIYIYTHIHITNPRPETLSYFFTWAADVVRSSLPISRCTPWSAERLAPLRSRELGKERKQQRGLGGGGGEGGFRV